MKKNLKTIIIIVILLLSGVLIVVGLGAARTYLSGAAGGCEPSAVRAQAEAKSTTISWQTDKECQGVIEYGTTPASLLLRALETQSVKTHRVVLSPLKGGTTYYFRVKAGETIYDNNGIPWSFKTKSADEETSGLTPTTVETTPSPTGVSVPLATPTVATGSSTSETKVTNCVKADFKEKFGTSDARYDFDNNGTVNTKDWIECLNRNQ